MPYSATIIEENTGHFEAIFACANLSIIAIDSNGLIKEINPFALKLFGYAEAELVGKKAALLIPERIYKLNPFDLKQNSNHYSKIKPTGNKELFAVKKNGVEFPIEINLGCYEATGEVYTLAYITNLSSRKAAKAEIALLNDQLEATVEQRTKDLQETLHQLEISNNKLETLISFQKAILDNAGAMIIATDKDGIIKLFNPEAEKNIGYTEAEVVDKHTPILFHLQNEIDKKRSTLQIELGEILENGFNVLVEKSTRNIHDEEQYTFVRKDGTQFPVLLTISTIRDSHGIITGFMGIAVDISARNKAEKELRESLKKEKELNELKSRFVSMASHEFRTPLSTVLSSAYLIEKYNSTDEQPKREKHLQRITSSVNMLTDILNDFLSLGKIEEGKIQVKLSEFNIYEQVTVVIGEMKNHLKKQQKIHYHHSGDAGVLLDVSLLKHIVMNLISNASKFSPEASPIEINTTCHSSKITLSVKDYGIGISMEDQQHLMERFFRGANADNIQGTGLGLHIISKYAELMSGNVTCTSELERGTTFMIMFNTKKD